MSEYGSYWFVPDGATLDETNRNGYKRSAVPMVLAIIRKGIDLDVTRIQFLHKTHDPAWNEDGTPQLDEQGEQLYRDSFGWKCPDL